MEDSLIHEKARKVMEYEQKTRDGSEQFAGESTQLQSSAVRLTMPQKQPFPL